MHHICQLKVKKEMWICNNKLKSYCRKYFFFRSSNCSSDDFWGELVDGCSVRESVTEKMEYVYWDCSYNWCTYTATNTSLFIHQIPTDIYWELEGWSTIMVYFNFPYHVKTHTFVWALVEWWLVRQPSASLTVPLLTYINRSYSVL